MRELGRRAVACARWRWMPGMLAIGGNVVASPCPPLFLVDGVPRMPVDGYRYIWLKEADEHPDVLPDLKDPATLGCLLGLLREVYGDPWAHVLRCAGGWGFHTPLLTMAPRVTARGEADCLVAALEAAP
jgi:hypothetical protein